MLSATVRWAENPDLVYGAINKIEGFIYLSGNTCDQVEAFNTLRAGLFQENENNIFALYHFSMMKCRRWLKSFLMVDKGLFILSEQ